MKRLGKKVLKNGKGFLLILIGIVVAFGILRYFYQYSQKSKATAVDILFQFSKTEITLNETDQTAEVDINILGTNKVSGATVLLQYPKDIISLDSIDPIPVFCNELSSPIIAQDNKLTGQVVITKVKTAADSELPPQNGQQFFCFTRLKFRGISSTSSSVRTGTITFIDGPVDGRSWQVVGPGTYTANHSGSPVTVTVNGQNFPSATPTPTVDPNITVTITPSPTISPTLTLTPTPTVTGLPIDNARLNFRIKFQGITTKPKNGQNLDVRVGLYKGGKEVATKQSSFSVQDDGTYVSDITYPKLEDGADYHVLIKGPKHLQKKICTNSPTESFGGEYQCKKSQIVINSGVTALDFSGIYMLSGDIPAQNNIIDSADIVYIRSNIGSQNADVIARGDLNYDGIVDSQDYALVIKALSFKYDEGE